MADPQSNIPVRAPADTSADDTVLPFEIGALELRGRLVRLGPAVHEILTGHNYPLPVAKLVGEAVVLTVLLGSALKLEGRFILQTKTDGPVRMLVVDYRSPGAVRACARFDAAKVAEAMAKGNVPAGALLGHGHLAMTIDQGAHQSRYQGVVALDGGDLEDAAHEYFKRSEQIPTQVRLAVGEELSSGDRRHWRAGGMLLQFLPKDPERARPDLDPGDAPEGTLPDVVAEDDAWTEGRLMISTVEDVELIDPMLSSEKLVYRLFHERGVRVFRSVPKSRRNARARATASRPCCGTSRRTIATTWWRTARSR